MYIVNAKAKDIYLLNITPLNLKRIFQWYNNKEFRFATGVEGNVSLQQLVEKYIEAKQNKEHFWVGIFITSTDEMIGVLQGQIKYEPKASVWISTLLIDKASQNKGYGTRAVNLFIHFIKRKSNISRFYITVSDINVRGCRFWESLGFKNCGRIGDYINFRGEVSNALIMHKLV